jgi:hypothetical protein
MFMKSLFWLPCLLWGCAFIILVSPSLHAAVDEEENPRLPLGMEVFLKKPEQRQYELHVHLTNISDEPVEVDVRDLPWNPTDGPTWLSAFRMDAAHSPIKQNVPLGRFGSRLVRLVPGESIQEKISLNHRIPSLLKEIEHHGVQLEWDCPPASLKFVCKQDSSRSITIPKDDPGMPDVYAIDQQECVGLEDRISLIAIPPDHAVLFLLGTEAMMTDLDKMKVRLLEVEEYVQRCHPTWTNSWAASFFTDKKFAGFLSDGENTRYFAQGLWQQANIGQYSSQIRTLFRFPWIKKRSDAVYLSLYRSPRQSKT